MGIVRGFSDLLKPAQNLATNGSFSINQRGLFNSWSDFDSMASGSALKLGDYPADVWSVITLSVDSCYCFVFSPITGSSPYCGIRFKGYGKKGQMIALANSDLSFLNNIGEWSTSSNQISLTASCVGFSQASSVPVLLQAIPKYYGTSYSVPYAKNSVIRPGSYAQAVETVSSVHGSYNTRASIQMTLLADGFYDFQICNFIELFGAFKHPPINCPVHYAEDLARCKRYYQTGATQLKAIGYSNGTSYLLGNQFQLPVEMAGSPSTSASMTYVYEEGSGTDQQANYTMNIGASSKHINWYVSKGVGGNKPASVNFTWTATV